MPRTPKGVRLGGRQKGTPNKRTVNVKAALEEAFERMGGVDALLKWGQQDENRTEFYKLWIKVMPAQVQHSGPTGGPIQVETKIDFSKIPTPELTEYESVLAKLRQRMAPPVGSPSSGEVQAPSN